MGFSIELPEYIFRGCSPQRGNSILCVSSSFEICILMGKEKKVRLLTERGVIDFHRSFCSLSLLIRPQKINSERSRFGGEVVGDCMI
jgi:hypothetical protein